MTSTSFKAIRKIQIAASLLGLFAYGWLIQKSGLLFNVFDRSMPAGIYQKISEKPVKGSLAITCLTPEIARYGLERDYLDRGHCPTEITPVLKKVIASEGDAVSFENGVLKVNGEPLSGYRVARVDSQGRPLREFYSVGPSYRYRLKEGEYWLMSDYKPNSWDSRYWGAVGIESRVKPVFLFRTGGLWKSDLSGK